MIRVFCFKEGLLLIGLLVPEFGDNEFTLAAYLNISTFEAKVLMDSQGYDQVLKLDNIFTRSIANSNGTLTTDKLLDYKRTGNRNFKIGSEDNYNCHGCSLSALDKKEINSSNSGRLVTSSIEYQINNILYDTKPEKATFGDTMIAFTNGVTVTHTAIFYGMSKDGTIYVYTKNGSDVRPEIMPLNDLVKEQQSTGCKMKIRYIF